MPDDALKRFKESHSRYQYIEVKEVEIVAVQKYPTLGRPKKEARPSTVGYQIVGSIACSLQRKAALERCKGYFVIATNDMSPEFS